VRVGQDEENDEEDEAEENFGEQSAQVRTFGGQNSHSFFFDFSFLGFFGGIELETQTMNIKILTPFHKDLVFN
jgi:hypothetical protein